MAPRYISPLSADQIHKIPDGSPILRFLDPNHADATAGHDGTLGNDVIQGSVGNDVIYGDGGFDRISSGFGNDLITVGSNTGETARDPRTSVDAGSGEDTITVPKGTHGTFNIDTGVGHDRVTVFGGDYIVLEAAENALDAGDTFLFSSAFRGQAWLADYDNASDTLVLDSGWHRDIYSNNVFWNDEGGILLIASKPGAVENVHFWDF